MARTWQISAAAATLSVILAIGANIAAGDQYTVPDGGPKEQAAFIQSLMSQRPHDADSAAKMRESALQSANKILAGKHTPMQLALAVKVKAAFETDPAELTALEAKLIEQKQKGAARTIHARLLLLQLQQVARGDADALKKQVEDIKEFVSKGPIDGSDAELAMAAGQIVEQNGNAHVAGDLYESMAKLLAGQPQTAQAAKQMQAVARRMKLVGNSMELEGKQLNGSSLQWPNYRGKVVLIDFWATWCGPCMAEVPNIKQNYEKYHKQGFDVIGISLDQMSSPELADFVKKEEVPWTICRDADSPNHMASYYGVNSIPLLILVGRDGKVITLNARGGALGPLVEKALAAAGPAAGDAVASDATDNSAKAAKPDHDEALTTKKGNAMKENAKAEALAAARKNRDEAAKSRAPKPRQWSDATGSFHQTATFHGMGNGMVKLQLEDGSVISVPMEKLSDEDQKYITDRKRMLSQ